MDKKKRTAAFRNQENENQEQEEEEDFFPVFLRQSHL